jgi:hypothetical protein
LTFLGGGLLSAFRVFERTKQEKTTEHVFFVMKEGVIYKNDRGSTAK